MRVLGNILWIILGGLAIAIGWALVGLILCISIIGIPLGVALVVTDKDGILLGFSNYKA